MKMFESLKYILCFFCDNCVNLNMIFPQYVETKQGKAFTFKR